MKSTHPKVSNRRTTQNVFSHESKAQCASNSITLTMYDVMASIKMSLIDIGFSWNSPRCLQVESQVLLVYIGVSLSSEDNLTKATYFRGGSGTRSYNFS